MIKILSIHSFALSMSIFDILIRGSQYKKYIENLYIPSQLNDHTVLINNISHKWGTGSQNGPQ